MKVIGIMLLFVGMATMALAQSAPSAPEIDASSAVSALALLSGSLLVLKGRRKK